MPVVRRSILRYALSCQDRHPQAAAFVAEQRQKNPDTVKDAEELLRLEKDPLPVEKTPAKK